MQMEGSMNASSRSGAAFNILTSQGMTGSALGQTPGLVYGSYLKNDGFEPEMRAHTNMSRRMNTSKFSSILKNSSTKQYCASEHSTPRVPNIEEQHGKYSQITRTD